MLTLFERLQAADSEVVRTALLEQAVPEAIPEARKACWAYRHVLKRRGEAVSPAATAALANFRSEYVAALRDHAFKPIAKRHPTFIEQMDNFAFVSGQDQLVGFIINDKDAELFRADEVD